MTDSTEGKESGTPAELVERAFHTEREAAWFYQMMAEMTSDEAARDTLMAIAKDERSHAETLLKLYFELTGLGITEAAPSRPEGDPNLFDLPRATRREALEFALRNETRAADFYQSQADTADDPRIGAVFRLLADTEREHAAYMRLQLERLDASSGE